MFENLPPSPAIALVRRELLVMSRSGRLFGVLAFLTGVLMLFAVGMVNNIAPSPSGMAPFAKSLFRTQFIFLTATAVLVVPVAAAAGMIAERKNVCFPLLYTTLITPGWIVWSKTLAVLGLYAIFFAACLPFTGLVYFFAGVEVIIFFQGALILFSIAFGGASIGMYLSVRTDDYSRALYNTGAAVLLLLILPGMGVFIGRIFSIQNAWLEWLHLISFFNAYGVVSSGFPDWQPPLAFAAVQTSVAIVALLLARRHVLPDRTGWKEHLANHLPAWSGWRRRKSHPPIADRQNPIAARDAWSNPLARGYRRYVVGLLGVFFGFLATWPLYVSPLGVGYSAIFGMERYLLYLSLPPTVAALFWVEKNQDTLDSLRTTLLDEKDLVWGKIRVAWRIILPFFAGIVVGRILFYAIALSTNRLGPGTVHLIYPLLSILALLVTAHAVIAFSLSGASMARTAASASVYAYGFVFVNFFACYLVTTLIYVVQLGSPNLQALHAFTYYVLLLILAHLNHLRTISRLRREFRAT